MPQPPAYSPSFSFTEDEAANPSAHVPGVSLDAEFSAIATTVIAILGNLVKIQRDDGALKNGSVTLDTMSPSVVAMFAAASSWKVRGAWLTATNYAASDIVSSGTKTYLCAITHVAGVLVNDVAAGKWVLLFDSAGSTPADNSVTTDKIADGAVTTPKLGIVNLDLAGYVRGQVGVSAGSAPNGSLMHAKAGAGDIHIKIERVADDDGPVGLDIIGVATKWTLEQPNNASGLQLTADGVLVASFGDADKLATFAGAVRATGGDPAAGIGVHLSYFGNTGYITAYDYEAGQWKDLKLRGKTVYITAGGVDVAKATSTGLDILPGKTLTLDGDPVGYLGIPIVADNDARTIGNADNGLCIYSENVAGQVITIPVDMDGETDFACLIINDGTSPITLTEGAGVELHLAGAAVASHGNRTIAAGGWCFVKRVKANRYIAGGNGTS